MNHKEATQKLGNRESKKLANNTYLQRRGNDIAVKLHDTDVVTFRPDNSAVYNSGGWRTVTTKDRMNNYGAAGVSIWQERGIWTIGTRENRKLYNDGVIVTARGRIIGGGNIKAQSRELKYRKQVNKYCQDYAVALIDGKVKMPDAGDCFYCHMVTVEDKKPLGDATKNHDHIREHIKEGYFVPSLLVNAANEPNAPIAPMIKGCIGKIWQGKDIGSLKAIVKSQVTKTIRKYIMRRLDMVA